MGKVTALMLDVITDRSGHQLVPNAVSVCLTPAAPSPLPIPYPVVSIVAEGIVDPPLRTKVNGRPLATVGSVAKACHGNEPGTLKEVLSLNTAGPCFILLGAPNVICELGMVGITTSLAINNKAITVGAGGNASNASGAGGGGGGGSGPGGPGGDGAGPQAPTGGGGGSGDGTSTGASVQVTQADRDKAAALGDPRITPEDIALARAPNRSTPPDQDQINARRRVAAAFYRKNGQKFDRNASPPGVRPLSHSERCSELACTDYHRPVDIGPPPPISGRTLYQYQPPGGNRGSYYAQSASTQPHELGIGGEGKAWSQPGQPVVPKQQNQHHVSDSSTPYLVSTASPADDTWSNPGTTQHAPGGGQQTYIPQGCDPNSTSVH